MDEDENLHYSNADILVGLEMWEDGNVSAFGTRTNQMSEKRQALIKEWIEVWMTLGFCNERTCHEYIGDNIEFCDKHKN